MLIITRVILWISLTITPVLSQFIECQLLVIELYSNFRFFHSTFNKRCISFFSFLFCTYLVTDHLYFGDFFCTAHAIFMLIFCNMYFFVFDVVLGAGTTYFILTKASMCWNVVFFLFLIIIFWLLVWHPPPTSLSLSLSLFSAPLFVYLSHYLSQD